MRTHQFVNENSVAVAWKALLVLSHDSLKLWCVYLKVLLFRKVFETKNLPEIEDTISARIFFKKILAEIRASFRLGFFIRNPG